MKVQVLSQLKVDAEKAWPVGPRTHSLHCPLATAAAVTYTHPSSETTHPHGWKAPKSGRLRVLAEHLTGVEDV